MKQEPLDILLKSVAPDQPSAAFTQKVMNTLPPKPIITKKWGWTIVSGIAAGIAFILFQNQPAGAHNSWTQPLFSLLHTDYCLLIPIVIAVCLVLLADFHKTWIFK